MNHPPYYSAFLNVNPQPSWVYDLKSFQILEVNQAALSYFGYSKNEFLLLKIQDLYKNEEIPILLETFKNCTENPISFGFFTNLKKHHKCKKLEIYLNKLAFNGDEHLLVSCKIESESSSLIKLLEEKNKQIDTISHIGKIGYWKLGIDNKSLSWTDEVYKIWGRNKDNFEPNFKNIEKTIHPDDLWNFIEQQNVVFEGVRKFDFIGKIIMPDFSIKWVHMKGSLITNSLLKTDFLEGTIQDITAQTLVENKLTIANDSLGKSENRFKIVQEISPDGFTILHPKRNEKGEIVDFIWIFENQAIATINGTDPNEIIGKSLLENFPSHQGNSVFESYIQVANTGKTIVIDEVYVGEIVSIHTWLRLAIVSMGDDIAILSQNITKRKFAEKELLKSDANFKAIFEIASLGIAQVDPSNGKIILINTFYEKITGYSARELYKMSFKELTHPEDRTKDWEKFSKAVNGEEEYTNEKRYVKKDGSIIWVRIHLAFTRDENGKPLKTVAICEDITERKETELRLQDVSNNLPGVVFQYIVYPDGTDAIHAVSNGAELIWGYSPEMVEKNIELIWNQTKAGGDYEHVKNSIEECIKNKTKWISRYKSVLPNGKVQTHLGSGTPNFLPDGTVLFNSVVLDITKEVKNEELLAQATQMSSIGSWEIDFVSDKIIWSEMLHQLHETNPATYEPTKETLLNFYRKDFHENILSKFTNCIKNGESFDIEIVLVTANNNEKWVRVMGQAEMIKTHCKRVFGSFQDIHIQKTNELVLVQSLKKLQDYQFALDQSASFTITDSEGVIIDVNDHFCRLSQYSREELIGSTHQIINSKQHPKEFFKVFWETIQMGKIWRGEVCNQKKDGTYYWVNTTIIPFLDKNNIPYQYLALRIDITQRKLAEEKIRDAYDKLKNIAWTQSHIVRAPVARILGIINLIEAKHESIEDILFWLKHLKDASNEMDSIIRKIVEETNSFE